MKSLLRIIALAGCVASVSGVNAEGATAPTLPAVQCRGTDRVIPKQIMFPSGRTTAVIKDTIKLCTGHEYNLRARRGQTMTVHLATGNRTSFTIHTPAGDTPEGADGVKDWSGELPERGDYTISIGTDATAAYTLEVTIR
jgi:hypothetical protein